MIKNLNDLISVFTLLLLVLFSIRILVFSFVTKNTKEKEKVNRFRLIREYIDNEEE